MVVKGVAMSIEVLIVLHAYFRFSDVNVDAMKMHPQFLEVNTIVKTEIVSINHHLVGQLISRCNAMLIARHVSCTIVGIVLTPIANNS